MDLSEELRRLFNYLDELDEQAEDAESQGLKNTASSLRCYVQAIAEKVGYATEPAA